MCNGFPALVISKLDRDTSGMTDLSCVLISYDRSCEEINTVGMTAVNCASVQRDKYGHFKEMNTVGMTAVKCAFPFQQWLGQRLELKFAQKMCSED